MAQRGFIKRRGATWTAYWKVAGASGLTQQTKGGFRTRSDAAAFLNVTLSNLQAGVQTVPSRITVGEYLTERWLPAAKTWLRPSTYDAYRRNIELHILPELGSVRLQGLTVDQLDAFYAKKLASGHRAAPRGLSPKTVRHLHTILHRALKDAVRKGLVVRNVADAADPPRLARHDADLRIWTAEELGNFLAGMAGDRLATAFLLAASTGMRRGEVLGLRWLDVDLIARRLAVRQTVVSVAYKVMLGAPKTAKGRRSIALDTHTVAALALHRDRQLKEKSVVGWAYRDQDLVFAREDGDPIHPDFFSQSFDRAVRRLGLPRIRLHDLRHTHASLGLAAGIAPKIMSERLGHATVAFTQDVYTHSIPPMEDAAADRLGRLIFGEPAGSPGRAPTGDDEQNEPGTVEGHDESPSP